MKISVAAAKLSMLAVPHFFPSLPIKVSMPTTRSQIQEKSEKLAATRGELCVLRTCLLQFLDRVGYDVVKVDDEKCIARVKNVTSKRITQEVLAGVVEVVVANSTGANNQTDIQAFAKHTLITAVDKVSWKGNVVAASSAEAKRRKRDDTEVRHGGSKLIDDVTMQCVDAYWNAIACRKELTPTKAAPISEAAEAVAPISEAAAMPPLPPSETKEPLPIAEEAVSEDVASPVCTPVKARPKSSVSKKQAFAILEAVSHLLATKAWSRLAETEVVYEQCLSVVRQHWPMI